jgi:hypothetical protein
VPTIAAGAPPRIAPIADHRARTGDAEGHELRFAFARGAAVHVSDHLLVNGAQSANLIAEVLEDAEKRPITVEGVPKLLVRRTSQSLDAIVDGLERGLADERRRPLEEPAAGLVGYV